MALKQYVMYVLLIEKIAWTMNTVGWTTSIAVATFEPQGRVGKAHFWLIVSFKPNEGGKKKKRNNWHKNSMSRTRCSLTKLHGP